MAPRLTGYGRIIYMSSPDKVMVAGVGMTTGAEIWTWLGTHNEQITAICSMIGASIAVIGFIVAQFRNNE